MASRRVTVSASQVAAAKLKIKRAATFGRDVAPAVVAIANAHKPFSGSTSTGRVHQPSPAARPATS